MTKEECQEVARVRDERGTYEGYWELDEDKFSDTEFIRRLTLLHNAYDYLESYVREETKKNGVNLDW